MSRKEIYNEIKAKGLQGEVKKFFKKNFTNVPTKSLEEFLKKKCDCSKHESKKKDSRKCCHTKVTTVNIRTDNSDPIMYLMAEFAKLLATLVVKEVITDEEAKHIMKN